MKGVNLRVRSVPLGVDGRQVPALLDGEVEAAGVDGVDHPELDFASDRDGAVAAALLRVDAQHRFGARLKNNQGYLISWLLLIVEHWSKLIS